MMKVLLGFLLKLNLHHSCTFTLPLQQILGQNHCSSHSSQNVKNMLKLLVFKWLLNRVLLETECSVVMLFWRFAPVKFIRSFIKFPFLIFLFKQFLFSYQHHWKHHSSTDIIMVTLFCFSSVFFPRNASFSCFFLSYCFN